MLRTTEVKYLIQIRDVRTAEVKYLIQIRDA